MCTSDDPEFCPHDDDEPQITPAPEITPAPALISRVKKPDMGRRTFLKAAALGGAAFGGLKLSGLSGLAHTDDKSPCTAGDIELTGGQIVNEPCECDGGNFIAVAEFQVRNDNNARRLNLTLHMGPGETFGGQDFVLNTEPDGTGSCSIEGLGTEQTMYANLGSVPCDFAGECYPGSVIAFQTANNQGDAENCSVPLTKYPGGQCRRQEICIVGFSASLTCSTEGCTGAPSDGCNVPCGGSLFLQAVAIGGTLNSNGTYNYVVTAPDGEVFESGAGQGNAFCFEDPTPTSGTYTLQAFDSQGCVREDTTTVEVVDIDAPDLVAGEPDCAGAATFTVTNCDPALTYTFESATGTPSSQGGLGVCEATFTFPQDGADHTVTVTASTGDPACDQPDSASVTINTPVTVSLGDLLTDCSGDVTVTATASGGSGEGYTFEWSVNGEPQPSVTGDTLSLSPQLDGECREVTVTATDSAGCVSDADAVSFSQCVATTICE